MQLLEHVLGDAVVLSVSGKLMIPDAGDQLERTVNRLARDGRRIIVANLKNVSAIDAGGFGSMVAAYRASNRNLVRFRLVYVPWRIQHLINITGLAPFLEVFDSLDAALANSHSVSSSVGSRVAARERPLGDHSASGTAL